MAEDDVETLAVLNYYMTEGYYRRVQMETMNAIRKYGSDPVLVLYKGLSMLMEAQKISSDQEAGRIQESMRELEGIRDRPDLSLASILGLIIAHRMSRNIDREAVSELEAKLKNDRRSAGEKGFYFAGLTLWLLQRPDKAKDYVDRLLKNYNNPAQGLILKAWMDLTSDRDSVMKKSVKIFDEALAVHHKEPWALLGKARSCMIRHKYSQALELLNQAVVAYSNFTPAFVERMRLHMALRDWDQALDAASRLLSLDTRHPEALKTQIVHALALEGKTDDVVTMIGDLIQNIDRFEPQNTNLYVSCGRLFSRMCGRDLPVLNQTFTLLERALSVETAHAEFTSELGYQYFLQGKVKEAFKCYQSAMNIDNGSVPALIGAIRCQLLADEHTAKQMGHSLDEVSNSLTFLNEVQQTIQPASELLFLTAVYLRKTNKSSEECYKYLSKAIKAHFESLKSLPFGTEYLIALNPDFVLEIVRELLKMGPSEAITQGEAIPVVLRDSAGVLNEVLKSLPGMLDALYLFAKVKFLAGEPDAAMATLQHCLDQDSSYGDAHLLMARIYQERGNNSLASQYLESALSHNFEIRDHPVYHLIKAKTLMKSGEVSDAVHTLKLALALPGVKRPLTAAQRQGKQHAITATDRLSIFLELVRAHQQNSEQHEAIKVMQDAINAFQGTPEEVRVSIANADLSLQRDEIEQALTMLKDIKPEQSYYVQAKEKMANIFLHHRRNKDLYIGCYRELAVKQPTAHTKLLLGDAYMNIQEPDRAIDVYEKVMSENPDDGALASKIGKALVKTHDYRRAIAYYETALNNGGQQHLRFELAELLLQLKMYDKVEKILTEISDDDRAKGETELERSMFDTRRLLLLACFYTERGSYENVAQSLTMAREKQARVLKRVQLEQPESVSAQKKIAADICCKLAKHQHERDKDRDQAIKFYKEALIYCENDPQAMLEIARLYLQSGELGMCQQYCMQLLKQTDTTGHSQASMMMADIMFRKNSYDEAIYHYQQLLEAKPDYYEALARLIGLLRRSGKLEEAPKFLGIADMSDNDVKKGDEDGMFNSKSGTSNDPGYHFCKGLYEWYSGRAKEALQSFNIARRDTDWGERSVENMIKICLNPDQDTLGGEVMDNSDSISNNEKMSAAEAGVSTAEKLLKELVKAPPSSPAAKLRRQILGKYVLLGTRRKPEAEKALSDFIEILKNERENISCQLGMAIAFQILKQTPKARNQLKRISKMQWSLEDGDDFEQAWLLLADLFIAAGKFDMASELLKKCIEHNKSCCKAFEYLGYIQEKEQSYQEAARSYEKAWSYGNGSNPSIGYKLSFNYLKAKRYIEAINICHKVLEKNPQYPKIKKDILDKARASIRT